MSVSNLRQLDLAPMVEAELEHLAEQMKKKLSRDVPRGRCNIRGAENPESPGSGGNGDDGDLR